MTQTGSRWRSLMSIVFPRFFTSGCLRTSSQPMWAKKNPRLALCGSASVSEYLWCTRWSRAHSMMSFWKNSLKFRLNHHSWNLEAGTNRIVQANPILSWYLSVHKSTHRQNFHQKSSHSQSSERLMEQSITTTHWESDVFYQIERHNEVRATSVNTCHKSFINRCLSIMQPTTLIMYLIGPKDAFTSCSLWSTRNFRTRVCLSDQTSQSSKFDVDLVIPISRRSSKMWPVSNHPEMPPCAKYLSQPETKTLLVMLCWSSARSQARIPETIGQAHWVITCACTNLSARNRAGESENGGNQPCTASTFSTMQLDNNFLATFTRTNCYQDNFIPGCLWSLAMPKCLFFLYLARHWIPRRQQDPERQFRLVGPVRPETMCSRSDTHTRHQVTQSAWKHNRGQD